MRSSSKKNSILTAASELFASVGYEATTFEKIAQKAAVGLGLIRYHYSTKEELYFHCAESNIRGLIEFIRQTCDSKTGKEAIKNYIERYFEYALVHSSTYSIVYTTSIFMIVTTPELTLKMNIISNELISYLEEKISTLENRSQPDGQNKIDAISIIFLMHGAMRANLSKEFKKFVVVDSILKFALKALEVE